MRKYHRIARLIEMVTMIRTNHHLRPRDLAEHFGVSEKRIFDDITDLNMAGVPIVFAESGYQILPTFFLPPPQLTGEETLALLMGAALLQKGSGGPARETIQSAIRKICAVSSPSDQERMVRISGIVTMEGQSEYPVKTEVLRKLTESFVSSHRIRIFQSSSSGNGLKEFSIDPYCITHRGNAWLLVGYCQDNDEVRVFHLDRIQEVELLPERFRKPGKNMLNASQDRIGYENLATTVDVVVAFDAQSAHQVSEKAFPHADILPQPDGSVHVRAKARGKKEVLKWVLQFGGNIEILEPVEIREEVRLIGRKISRIHNQNAGLRR